MPFFHLVRPDTRLKKLCLLTSGLGNWLTELVPRYLFRRDLQGLFGVTECHTVTMTGVRCRTTARHTRTARPGGPHCPALLHCTARCGAANDGWWGARIGAPGGWRATTGSAGGCTNSTTPSRQNLVKTLMVSAIAHLAPLPLLYFF